MFPIISVLAQIGNVFVDKITLTRRQVALHVFVPVLFLFLFLLTVLVFPWLGKISPAIFSTYYLIIFISMIASAIIWNIFYYRGVQTEKVHEFELILMFQPLMTIILASVFLNGEQNLSVIIASIIAGIALIVSHLNKTHLDFSAGAKSLILAVIFMSIELILIKIMLNVLSPVALYAIRTGILFIFFYLYYRPDMFKVSNANTAFILLSALLGTAQMIAKFYGFQEFGVVYTSLILIAAPLTVYMISTIFLHERLKARTVACAVVILLCIVYATVLGK